MCDSIEPGANAIYWDEMADAYHELTDISTTDFHYGPLIPGDSLLGLLPRPLAGKRCLELACGGAQNSIFLARNGAECVALDASSNQLEYAAELANAEGVSLTMKTCSFEDLPSRDLGRFDVVHSSFGLPFAEDPESVVRHVASHLLAPGGVLLISLAHPVSAGEWLEVDDEDDGMFLKSYFDPEPDVRETASGKLAGSLAYPIGETIRWILDAGLRLDAMLEPIPMDVTAPDFKTTCPYYSEAWMALAPQLSRVPFIYILKASLPA